MKKKRKNDGVFILQKEKKLTEIQQNDCKLRDQRMNNKE